MAKAVGPKELPPFVYAAQASLQAPVFTIDLPDTSTPMMTLGSIDHSRYTGELTTVPADTSYPDWILNDVSFAVDGKTIDFTQKQMVVGTTSYLSSWFRTQSPQRYRYIDTRSRIVLMPIIAEQAPLPSS